MSEKTSEKSKMSSVEFVQDALRNNVAPPGSGVNIGDRIRLAARRLGWAYSRTRDAWYGDTRMRFHPDEIRKIEEKTGLRYGRQEVAEIDALISRADELLARRNPYPDSALVGALRAFIGALDRAGAEGQ